MIFHQLDVRVVWEDSARMVPPSDLSVQLVERGVPDPRAYPLAFDTDLEVFAVDDKPSGEYRLEVFHFGSLAARRRVRLSLVPQKKVITVPVRLEDYLHPDRAHRFRGSRLLGVVPRADLAAPIPSLANAGWSRLDRPAFRGKRLVVYSALEPGDEAAERAGPAADAFASLEQIRAQDWVESAGPFEGRHDAPGAISTDRVYLQFELGTPRSEVDETASKYGLAILERLPVERDMYLARAGAATDVLELVARFNRDEVEAHAEPVKISELELDAQPREFDPAWYSCVLGLEEAKQLVSGCESRPVVAVIDQFHDPDGSLGGHPELAPASGSDSGALVLSLGYGGPRGLESGEDVEDLDYDHALLCAGLVAGRETGTAPWSRLLVVADPEDNAAHLRTWLWAAGLGEPSSQNPYPELPVRGADIFSASIGRLGGVSTAGLHMLKRLTVEGRNGRGCLTFFSAGNDPYDIQESRSYGASPYALAIAASSRTAEGLDTFACYTGFGDVDLCAPSGAVLEYQSQGDRYDKVLVCSRPHSGCYSLRMSLQTTMSSDAPSGSEAVQLASSDGFALRRSFLALGARGEWTVAELAALGSPPEGRVLLSTGLDRPIPNGTRVVSGSRWVGRLKQRSAATSSILELDRSAKALPGQRIVVTEPGSGQYFGYTIEKVCDRVISVKESLREHEEGDLVLVDECHFRFAAGTSTSTPVCAGVASLVLQANPKLTWVEVRHILRATAVRIDPTCSDPVGRWLGRTGKPDPGAPYYSRRYGFGRVHAAAAVRMARDFHMQRDLMIRRQEGDDGTSILSQQGESPDIWVRSLDPRRLPPHEREDPCLHETLRRRRNHWIFVRVCNRGRKASLEAWVRFFVAPSQPEPYRFPEDFESWGTLQGGHDPNRRRTQFLGEVPIVGVPPGGSHVVSLLWPARRIPPFDEAQGPPWEPHLLVAISPLDGPLEGSTVLDHNNLAQRKVHVEE